MPIQQMVADLDGLALTIAVSAGVVLLWRLYRRYQDTFIADRILTLVEAAEQFSALHTGAERLDWVTQMSKKHLPKIDPELLRALIEAAVHRMKAGQREWIIDDEYEPDNEDDPRYPGAIFVDKS